MPLSGGSVTPPQSARAALKLLLETRKDLDESLGRILRAKKHAEKKIEDSPALSFRAVREAVKGAKTPEGPMEIPSDRRSFSASSCPRDW